MSPPERCRGALQTLPVGVRGVARVVLLVLLYASVSASWRGVLSLSSTDRECAAVYTRGIAATVGTTSSATRAMTGSGFSTSWHATGATEASAKAASDRAELAKPTDLEPPLAGHRLPRARWDGASSRAAAHGAEANPILVES